MKTLPITKYRQVFKQIFLFVVFLLSISQSILAQKAFPNFDQYLQSEVAKQQLVGVHGLVYQDGKVVYNQYYGQRDREENVAMNGQELYYLQSMSKPIVSVALMTLFEKGKFALNDPVEKYLPEFANMQVVNNVNLGTAGGTHPAKNKITIEQLLSHTSGLSHGLTPLKMDREIWNAVLNPSIKTVADRVKEIAKLPLSYEPGTKWNYSFSTDVLSRLIEVLSGETTEQYLKKNIFTPLGMKDAGYNLSPEQQKRIMTVYDFNSSKKLDRSTQPASSGITIFAGINALFGTMHDYLQFASMLYNGGTLHGKRILKKETIDLMLKDQTATFTNKPNKNSPMFKLANGIVFGADGSSNLEPGYGFGLGFAILNNPTEAGRDNAQAGEYFWSGANSTHFFIHPEKKIIGIFMTQIGSIPNPNPLHYYFGDQFRKTIFQDLK
ncbi:serine hydrolase domain-containing protein [Aquirufa sp. ROCK2-A2]